MKLRPFELTLVIIFGVMAVASLIILRTYQAPPAEDESLIGTLAIWGTIPQDTFDSVLAKITAADAGFKGVRYRYIPEEDFDDEFVNALADQQSPDLVLINQERLTSYRNRLQVIPYESYPLRDFRNVYVEGAEVYALSDGIYGLPLMVDPLVMYWNRDMFSQAGFLAAPTTWEEVVSVTVPEFTVRDFNRTIQQSGIAMGVFDNVKNAFPVLSTLLLQGGSRMVVDNGTRYDIALNEATGAGVGEPLAKAFSFYANFSNPNNSLYSWNRALRPDTETFLSEDLALYFGFSSEGTQLEQKNPNLNFDVAEVPQGKDATAKRTYGRFYSFQIPKAAKNSAGAFTAMQTLASAENAALFTEKLGMAPVHRALIASGSNDIYGRVAYSSSFFARGWLNPKLPQTEEALKESIEDINANRADAFKAANDLVYRLGQVY